MNASSKKLLDIVGEDLFRHIVKEMGGATIYISNGKQAQVLLASKYLDERLSRNVPLKQIANEFSLCEHTIRNIIKKRCQKSSKKRGV